MTYSDSAVKIFAVEYSTEWRPDNETLRFCLDILGATASSKQ